MKVLSNKQIEEVFNIVDDRVEAIVAKDDKSYMEALSDVLAEIIDYQNVEIQEVDHSKQSSKLAKVNQQVYGKEVLKAALMMNLLKVARKDHLQANYQPTPDVIADIFGYLVSSFFAKQKDISIMDVAMGSGNLLTTVYFQLNSGLKINPELYGIENDDTMFNLAANLFEILEIPAQIYHEDTITDVVAPKVDVAISDLPIGYYPIDDNVNHYQTKAAEGHSYVHHLMIEMAMNHVNDDGFGIFLVPSQIFQTGEAKTLLKWIQENAYLQGMLNLPSELFKDPRAQKAILIIQKSGQNAKQAEPVMIGEFPSFKDQSAMKKFLQEINDWRQNALIKK